MVKIRRGAIGGGGRMTEQCRALFSVTNLLSLFEAAGRHHGKTI